MFKKSCGGLVSLTGLITKGCANEFASPIVFSQQRFAGLFTCEKQLISLRSFLPAEQAVSQGPLCRPIQTLATLRAEVPVATPALRHSQTQCFSTQTSHRGQQRLRLQKRTSDQGLYLVALVIGMIGVTYASVPLYRMFCQATGYGGTVQQGSTVEEKLKKRAEEQNADLEEAAAAREITVSFNADVTDGMNWRFVPTQRAVQVHPGQSTLAFYTAHNLSDKAVTGVSTYNVSPQQAGAYFNKIQCFCFEEQKLRPGEKIDMPVFFYIDPEFALDKRMKNIDHLTLSYTFFKVAEEDDDGGEDHTLPVEANLPQAAVA